MISITDLIQDSTLKGNYFAPDAYIQGDYESGLLENRQGARLIALPHPLLEGIYAGLEHELGAASGLVMFKCGRWWGKSFYRRFATEISQYYQQPLAQMEMIEFVQSFRQCWQTHGWGEINLDFDYYQQGFIVAEVINSAFAASAPVGDKPQCFVEAGILSAFFSQLTGRELHCIQTSCESLKDESNMFILGLAERLKPVEAWLAEQQNHRAIIQRLCN
ncbi:MAG: 4-vinyl reductase [Cyanobacteria bacterium J083]|nr:MAG: 4-vinyl reductase [Cyanobacteria bacterium J083]